MPYIDLPEGLPGILGSMTFRPETAKPLNGLGTWAPPARDDYEDMGKMIVQVGYAASTPTGR